jgi:hypothetical protein
MLDFGCLSPILISVLFFSIWWWFKSHDSNILPWICNTFVEPAFSCNSSILVVIIFTLYVFYKSTISKWHELG